MVCSHAKGSGRVERVPRPVNRQQGLLDHIVDAVGRNALEARHALDGDDTMPQQDLIGHAISALGARHPARPARIFGSEGHLRAHFDYCSGFRSPSMVGMNSDTVG